MKRLHDAHVLKFKRRLHEQDAQHKEACLKRLGVESGSVRSEASEAQKPPYCNTGGYGTPLKINDLFKTELRTDLDLTNTQPHDEIQITAIDWLRVTTSDLNAFQQTLAELDGDLGLFAHADIDVKWSEKGLHGYETSASLLIWKDNDYLTVGHIATSETGRNRGGMLELSGTGCKVLQLEYPQLWYELYDLLTYFEWRIARTDIALDLSGEYAEQCGYTVPKLYKQAVNEGLFKSDNLRNPNMQQTFGMAGDWSPLVVGNITPESYEPLKHCPAGLTAYIGNRKSADDFFRVYEKGKELLGRLAEEDNIDRGWIRIEHEMSRKASRREIPLEVMLKPDEYFASNRSGVRDILDQLRQHQSLEQAKQWQRQQFKREKGLLLSKKIHWARQSYGRLFRTLLEQGYEPQAIVAWLARTEGLKEFVLDLQDQVEDMQMHLCLPLVGVAA